MDERAFLDGLRARPDDATTRLVYADWLDEQGGELAERPVDERLRGRTELTERAAVGVVAPGAAELLTAPVVQWLDQRVASGVRDAWGAAPGVDFSSCDPLAALEAALDRVGREVDAPGDALRIALEVAREGLSHDAAPAVAMADT